MSSYSELIKNFEKIREYMREFYVYGFKSREAFVTKSARSYDDERRRLESWLGDYMGFVRNPEGKNVFISIDSRTISHNPLYRAWKAKSFTDGDITLHFIIFDILHSPDVKRTVPELLCEMDEKYLCGFPNDAVFDESTVRKKLKEYMTSGIIIAEKEGRKVYYRRAENTDISSLADVLHFFSEVAPCGVVGSFLLDKINADTSSFTFKHHYITNAIDSGVTASLFAAMREKRAVTVCNASRRELTKKVKIVPLRIMVSVQNGKHHLLAYLTEHNCFHSYRIDNLSNVKPDEVCEQFDLLRTELDRMQSGMWGISIRQKKRTDRLEHVEFIIKTEKGEDFIINRLQREKRTGSVENLGDGMYRYSANVYDTYEMIPWIRTFICRIVDISFSNKATEEQFKKDLCSMYRIYKLDKEV